RIVERRRRALELGVVELPRRRPLPPEQLAELAPVLLEARAAALGVEVPLVPVRALLGDGRGRRRRQRVLHVVTADGDQRADALGSEDGGDAGGAAAPVVAGEARAWDAQGVHEVEQVLADGGLL